METESNPGWSAPGQAVSGPQGSGVVTLCFADVVGSTALKEQLGDRAGVALVQEHHALLRKILEQFPGAEEISTAGDSFLLVFIKPSDAVRFALLLQARLGEFNRGRPVPVEDRIGLHLGEVVIEETGAGKRDVHGMQVDTGARVMGLAQARQILMTRPVFDNARQSLKGEEIEGISALDWLNHGRFELRGVGEPVEICEVRAAGAANLSPPTTSEKARRVEAAEGEAVLGWRPAVGTVVPNTKWVLEQKLGEGGFGEVWLGRHQVMKERRVFKFCFRADRVRSLKREMTLFRLIKERIGDHPNIVSLREVYFDQPPYYVEEDYSEGEDLASWCAGQGGAQKVALATKLELVAQIADALQAAHDAGVIHRDVKPANILVSGQWAVVGGQKAQADSPAAPRPSSLTAKLTDFGIGQVISEELLAGVTKAGFTETMLSPGSSQTGTQLYMAPELFGGKPASTRSDIYSLGVVLWQLLVGGLTEPVTGDWSESIEDPVLKEDLKHCLAGKPQERFTGAGQLAKNLRAWAQRREELKERQRLQRQSARRRRTARASGALAAGSLLLAAAFGYGLNQARKQERRAEANLYAADVSLAFRSFEENNLGTALGLLGQHRPKPGEPDLRGWEWRYLWQQCQSDELFLLGRHSYSVTTLVFAPDGNTLASGSYDRTVRIWDLRARRLLATLPHNGLLNALAFSPDGKWLATATSARNEPVRLWETSTWRSAGQLAGGMPVGGLAFSPDGETLATVSEEGGALWEISSRRQLSAFPATGGSFCGGQSVSFSPNGQLLAYHQWDGTRASVCLRDLAAGKQVAVMAGHRAINAVAFSPDGKCLASAGWDNTVRIWDVARQVQIQSLTNHTAWVSSLAFLPDGSALATAGADQRIRLWNTTDWRETATLKGHRDEVWALACSPDGKWLATGDKDGTIRFWDAVPKARETTLTHLPAGVVGYCVEPAAEGFALIYEDGTIGFWKMAALAEQKRVPSLFPPVDTVAGAISPGGRLVAQALKDRTIRLWDSESRQEKRRLGPLGETMQHLAFSRDGDRLAAVGEGWLEVWQVSTGREVARRTNDLGPLDGWLPLAFAADGRSLCTGHSSGAACLWRLEGGGGRIVLQGHRWDIFSLAFAPSGNLVATTSGDGSLKLWDPKSGRQLATLRGQLLSLHSVAFSLDGRRVAAGTGDGLIKLWDTASFREVGTLRGPDGIVGTLAFLPDGGTVVAAGERGGTYWLRLWRAPSSAAIDAAEKAQANTP